MKKSLKFKMLFIFSTLLLVACLLVSILIYRSSVNLVKDSIGRQASIIVEQAVTLIDLNQYEKLSIDSKEEGFYKELRTKLNEMREANKIEYLYTMSRVKNGDKYNYYYMVDGRPFGDEDASNLGDIEDNTDYYSDINQAFDTGKTVYQMSNDKEYGALITVYTPIKSTNGETIGIIGADIDATNFYKEMDRNKIEIGIITVSVLFISIIIVYFFTNYLTKPLRKLTEQVQQVGNGDLSINIETDREDEVGILTHTFQQMVYDLRKLINSIHSSSSQLIDTSNLLMNRSNKAKEASQLVSASIEEVAAGAYTQYKSSEESATTLEDMSNGIQQIAQTSTNVAELSFVSLSNAKQGNSQISNIVNQMNVINESVQLSSQAIQVLENQSNEILSIINIIRDIATQTNLLALNAAIEAARAGENGKGFAVVAEEVRKLAEQSEQSASSISTLISKINSDTGRTVHSMNIVTENVAEGIKIVEEAGTSFNHILHSIEKVVSQIDEVSSTSEEMSAYSEEITASLLETTMIANQAVNSTKEVAKMTGQQENYMNDIAFSVQKLNDLAEDLDGLIRKFVL